MHPCTHKHLLKEFHFKGLKKLTICGYLRYPLAMDSGNRKTGKYSFIDPKIDELISLYPEIECSADFRKKYGSIIPLMKQRMKEGILSTLVQFYDPTYH